MSQINLFNNGKVRAKPEYQERKVNATEEGTQWKGTVPLEKKDEEFFSGTRVRAIVTAN